MLHPIHSVSLIVAHLSDFSTLIHILPCALIGQTFLHSRLHFYGLHFSGLSNASLFFSFPMVYKIFLISLNKNKIYKSYKMVLIFKEEKKKVHIYLL